MSTVKSIPGPSTTLCWIKSSYSSEEGGECVEVAVDGNAVHVRDSKQIVQGGPVLKVGPAAWTALLEAV